MTMPLQTCVWTTPQASSIGNRVDGITKSFATDEGCSRGRRCETIESWLVKDMKYHMHKRHGAEGPSWGRTELV